MSFMDGKKHGQDDGLFLRTANSAVSTIIAFLGCLVFVLIFFALFGWLISLVE